MKHLILTVILPFLVPAALATEIDDTSSYYARLKDSEDLLNAKTEQLIQAGLDRHFGCDRRTLARQMASVMVGNLFYGTVEAYANTSSYVERAYIPANESIYKGTPYDGGFVDTFVNLGPTVNVAGFHVGTDKIGHFIDMGYDLYVRAKMGGDVASLLAQSHSEEGGLWGSLVTGVKSYGDIAANFDGHRFWRDLIDEGTYGFLICENGRFKKIRAFKWSDYISAAWTEAINCSSYWSEAYSKPIARNILALEKRDGRRYACPVAPAQCQVLKDYYARWIPSERISEIISPDCK